VIAMSGLAQFKDLCIDAGDHQAQADWWCTVLGYERRGLGDGSPRPHDWPQLIVDPSGAGPMIWVVPVPEGKVVKNRMHMDVFGPVAALLAAGASMVLPKGEDRDWDVLADPEGNEFCVFEP
jgi:hypothetical protein